MTTIQTIGGTIDKDPINENFQALNDGKVEKETGKGLSQENYTSAEKTKLSGIESGAEVNVIESIKLSDSAEPLTPSSKTITIPNATTSADGLMSSEDKTKINGIESGAQVNPANYLKNASVSDNTLTLTKQDDSTVTFSGGSGSSIHTYRL